MNKVHNKIPISLLEDGGKDPAFSALPVYSFSFLYIECNLYYSRTYCGDIFPENLSNLMIISLCCLVGEQDGSAGKGKDEVLQAARAHTKLPSYASHQVFPFNGIFSRVLIFIVSKKPFIILQNIQ
jgi:hypothetical protein